MYIDIKFNPMNKPFLNSVTEWFLSIKHFSMIIIIHPFLTFWLAKLLNISVYKNSKYVS